MKIKLNLEICKDTHAIISEIRYEFERNSEYFYSVRTLCDISIDWYLEDMDYFENEYNKEKKLKKYINQYNSCIKSLETYEKENGQTYDDVYKEKIQNLIEIFNEMLEFAGDEEYKQRKDDLFFLIYKVGVYYPYYFDTLIHLQAMLYDVNETIISKINGMNNMYENFSKAMIDKKKKQCEEI